MNEAVQQFQQALNPALVQDNSALADFILIRLKSYQAVLPQSQSP
jgi:hypothetical protein